MNIQEFRKEVKGKFFKACFFKKDGTIREMVARLGVKTALKGGKLTYDAESMNYLTVFDVKKREYRTINIDALIYLKYNGKKVLGSKALLGELSW